MSTNLTTTVTENIYIERPGNKIHTGVPVSLSSSDLSYSLTTPLTKVNNQCETAYERVNLVININNIIKEVNIIVPNKVVEVVFADDTKEKAVCQEPDVFSLEMAIGICISKKIMGGSSAYNNAIRKGIKVYEKQEKAKAEEEKRKNAAERKRKKRIEKKQKKAKLKKDAEKREKIEIQREAYIQAMEYMEHRKNCK